MHWKKGGKLYVRIDRKAGEKNMTQQDLQNHLAYVKNAARERYLIGGGFSNTDGGMLLFEARQLEEAQEIAQNDPLIKRGFYRCDVFEWNLAVLSQHDANR